MNPRLAVITGSTKGIGEACARRFLAEGLTVVGISTSAPGEPLASHRGYHAVVGDVGDPAAWERVVAIYRDLSMPPTSLVLNAARARIGTVLTVSMETWRQQFEDNFFGAVLGARACLPDMIAAGGGSVVSTSWRRAPPTRPPSAGPWAPRMTPKPGSPSAPPAIRWGAS